MEAIEVKVVQPTFIGPTGPFSVEEVDAVRAFLFKSVRDVAWKVGLYGRQGAANWDEVTAKLRETITAIFFSVENRIAGLHNKEEKAPVLVARMLEGKNVALVSDAGTPGISDPGYFLINLAVDQKVPVVPIPGATAAIAALSISGLPTDSFVFEGFLPGRHAARLKRLEQLKQEKRTMVLYEAPHRIHQTIDDMVTVLGDRKAVATRELTKIHEEAIRGTLPEIRDHLAKRTTKGEFTIIVHGAEEHPRQANIDPAEYLRNLILHQGLSKKDAVAAAAKELGLPKKEVYKESLKI